MKEKYLQGKANLTDWEEEKTAEEMRENCLSEIQEKTNKFLECNTEFENGADADIHAMYDDAVSVLEDISRLIEQTNKKIEEIR